MEKMEKMDDELLDQAISNYFSMMNGTYTPPSREETIEKFEETLSNVPPKKKKFRINPSIGEQFKKSQNSSTSKITKDFKPIKISDLVFDTTHKQKYIKLKVITKILQLKSIMFIGEDEDKKVLEISIYNYRSHFGTFLVPELEIILKKDASFIIIIEPYYKFFIDGLPGIRVDDPKEVLVFENEKELNKYLVNINEDQLIEMKKVADNLMQEKKYKEAIDHYKKLVEKFGGNANLYSNISEGYLKINDNKMGLLYAKMSLKLDQKNIESQFRLIRAFYGMKKYQEALDFYNGNDIKNNKEFPEIENLINEINTLLKQNEK